MSNVVVITNLLSVSIECRRLNIKVKLIKSGKIQPHTTNINIFETREIVSGEVSYKSGVEYANAFRTALERMVLDSENVNVFCWNGQDLKGAAVNYIKTVYPHKMKTYFLEISNFPGYIFCDSLGVNAKSSAYLSGDFINCTLNFDDKYYENLIGSLVESKNNYQIPQSKLSKKVSFRHFLDGFYCLIFGVYNFSFKSACKRLKGKLSVRNKKKLETESKCFTSDYVFFPLQVSTDSQLLLNYGKSLLESLIEADKYVKSISKRLVVKIHPAENDAEIISSIKKYIIENDIEITFRDTNDIVLEVDSVVTVNSTVGFEAALIGKDVKYLGRTQYSRIIERSDIYKYIAYHFFKIDFFDDAEIDVKEINRLLGSF